MKSSQKTIKNKNHPKSIKIIGGRFRGKILHSAILKHTRPTKAIVKESIFNTLRDKIENKVFLEVFAGYGSVGFEAFSRGAKKVIFIEKNPESFKIILKNINLFDSEALKAYARDSFDFFQGMMHEVDILYFDPPFGKDGEYYKKIFEILTHTNIANKVIIFEHISSFIMPQTLGNEKLDLYKTRKFGNTSISYYF